jgi:hypothetical protein
MKRGNHDQKKGDHQPVILCRHCGHKARSKYESKNHVCRGG